MSKFSVQNGVTGSIPFGNPRGNASTDMQFVRIAANQVASGYASLIGGGARNRASNFYSAVLGGFANTSSGVSAITAGSGNVASGENSVALGGANTSSGAGSFTLGLDNRAVGQNSVAIGNGNLASGVGSGIIGSVASSTLTTGITSLVLGGSGGLGYLPGQVVTNARGTQYSGGTPEIGTLQVSEVMVSGQQLVGAGLPVNPMPLTLDGGAPSVANQLFMFGNNKTWSITVDWMVVGLNGKIMGGKDIVIVDKVAGVVRFIQKANINFIGDPTFKNQFTTSYTSLGAPVDLVVSILPTGTVILNPSLPVTLRATAKLTILELKNN
jgi:hypothetical protein